MFTIGHFDIIEIIENQDQIRCVLIYYRLTSYRT